MTVTITRDVVEILQEELQEISAAVLAAPVTDASNPPQELTDLVQRLQRFAAAARTLELQGLESAALFAEQNVSRWLQRETVTTPTMWRLIVEWPLEVNRYLERLGEQDCGRALVDFLLHPEWIQTLSMDEAVVLSARLAIPQIGTPPVQHLPEGLDTQGLSLQIPGDVSPALVAALLQEVPELTERLAELIDAWADNRGDAESLSEALRVAHTIKGAANTVGVRGIATFTHVIEELLTRFARLPAAPDTHKARVRQAAECLLQMSDALLGRCPAPAHAAGLLKDMLAGIHNDAPRAGTQPVATTPAGNIDKHTPADPPFTPVIEPDGTHTPARAPLTPALKVEPALIDDIFRLAGESTVLINQMHARLQHLQQLAHSLTQRLSVARNHTDRFLRDRQSAAMVETRIPGPLANSLRDGTSAGSLSVLQQNMQESIADACVLGTDLQQQIREFEELLAGHERMHEEQRDRVKQCRMLAASEIVPRLQRGVRQVCESTGKDVQLEIAGAHTLVDSHILNGLVEPLMHAMRNAIDHGIEPDTERVALGKPAHGRIAISFMHEGSDVIIHCRDDGRGLNAEAIRLAAIRQGLITDTEQPTDEQLHRLILRPGFSTRSQATQTSGRGVGMSAIATQIAQLKGTLAVDSRPQHGCSIEFRVPDSMLSMGGLLVRVNGAALGVAGRGLQRILTLEAERITRDDNGAVYGMDGLSLPVRTLEELMYGTRVEEKKRSDGQFHALLLGDADQYCVVLVEAILATRNLVVKSPGFYLSGMRGLLGTTILTDGNVVPVIDLIELLRQPTYWRYCDASARPGPEENDVKPIALVVDDSLSVRRELCAALDASGYATLTASDGVEGWEILQDHLPHLAFVDADMPRMGGLELTARLRADARLHKLPIIMMSAGVEGFRDQARKAGANMLLQKPLPRDALSLVLKRLSVAAPANACA